MLFRLKYSATRDNRIMATDKVRFVANITVLLHGRLPRMVQRPFFPRAKPFIRGYKNHYISSMTFGQKTWLLCVFWSRSISLYTLCHIPEILLFGSNLHLGNYTSKYSYSYFKYTLCLAGGQAIFKKRFTY